MPEPIEQPVIVTPPVDAATELTVLKQAHQEVLTKRQRDKARIAELESASTTLQTKLTLAENQIREVAVSIPLRQLAESISTVPDTFLETFGKHFKVESKDGVLTVLTKDGKAVTNAEGQAVKFDRTELAKYLTESEPDSERTKMFKLITVASRATGAAGTTTIPRNKSASTESTRPQFGLR